MNINRITVENLKHDRNLLAAMLSVLPGLGHIYKGYYGVGFAIMLLGVPIGLWVGLLLSLATAGVGLLVPIAAWAFVVMDAYYERDHRKHHWFGVV